MAAPTGAADLRDDELRPLIGDRPDGVGGTPRTGFSPHLFLTEVLVPEGLGQFHPDNPAVLYLHGAVGWYLLENDEISAQAADRGYNESLGRPAVLYPDPDKEIERSETAQLWAEFKTALENASHVLVIGHALNDPYLLQALREAAKRTQIGYVAHADDDLAISEEKRSRIAELLPEATMIPGQFGPEPRFDDTAWSKWTGGDLG
jgi:hypothetical protein